MNIEFPIRVTEAWTNKQAVIDKCKENKACVGEFVELIKAQTQDEFEEVLYSNFRWCVNHDILLEWLPEIVYAKNLHLPQRLNNIKSLPELPNCKNLYISHTRGIKNIEDLPNLQFLHANLSRVQVVRNLPNCIHIEAYCSDLVVLQDIPNCEFADISGTPLKKLPPMPNIKLVIGNKYIPNIEYEKNNF